MNWIRAEKSEKDKLDSIGNLRKFFIFTFVSVALYRLIMSIHISAKQGDIADKILLPGDPLRAKFIAENFLEDAVCFNEVRNMFGYTGTYKGERISVMGTGTVSYTHLDVYKRQE